MNPYGAPPHGYGPPPGQPMQAMQQAAPQQAYGPPGQLIVSLDFLFLQWILFFCKPVVEVNGQTMAMGWGRKVLDLPAGIYQVRCYYSYLWGKSGMATLQHVQVAPGYATILAYYAPVFFVIFSGKMQQLGWSPMQPQMQGGQQYGQLPR